MKKTLTVSWAYGIDHGSGEVTYQPAINEWDSGPGAYGTADRERPVTRIRLVCVVRPPQFGGVFWLLELEGLTANNTLASSEGQFPEEKGCAPLHVPMADLTPTEFVAEVD